VSQKGYILTNNHVIEGADQIAVALPAGNAVPARVVGTDPESDLAVLRVEAEGLVAIAFGDSDALQVGDVVLAVGDPFGVGQTVTQGIVSATGRNRLGINTFENFIQTDAAINPGNSGGALVDIEGKLVGINSAIFSKSGGFQGIGFAIPVSLAREVMDQIIAKGRVERGWLGVQAQDLTPEVAAAVGAEASGALISGVAPGGPAQRGGLQPGDIVREIGGKAVADTASLVAATAALPPGSRAQLGVERAGRRLTVDLTLGRRPPLRSQ
jgi:serine protease DegQ